MAYAFNSANSQYLKSVAPVASMPITMAVCAKTSEATIYSGVIICISNHIATDRATLRLAGDLTDDPVRAVLLDGTNTGAGANTTSGFSANQFTYCVGVYESTSSRSAYINGGSKETNTTALGSVAAFDTLVIGCQAFNNDYYHYYIGQASEVAIWSVALTDAEIASLAKGFKPTRIRPQSLVFYAPLLRNLQDLRGGLALTNNNGATVAAHPRVY